VNTVDFDVVVVGGGVVGLATARACTLKGLQVLVLEAAEHVGFGISSRNSEVIHAGLHYPQGSLKARLCVRGSEALYSYCQRRGIPHNRCGKLVVATEASQHPRLAVLFEQAVHNGVRDLKWLTGDEARQLEPNVSYTSAFLSPNTGIVDSAALIISLVADLEAQGGCVSLRTEFEMAIREKEDLPDHREIGGRVLGGVEPLAHQQRRTRIDAGRAACDWPRARVSSRGHIWPRATTSQLPGGHSAASSIRSRSRRA
jgi:L-2-hydroxyglutarate oxidase LhgO